MSDCWSYCFVDIGNNYFAYRALFKRTITATTKLMTALNTLEMHTTSFGEIVTKFTLGTIYKIKSNISILQSQCIYAEIQMEPGKYCKIIKDTPTYQYRGEQDDQ